MTIVIANLNNLAIGVTSFHLLWINCGCCRGVASAAGTNGPGSWLLRSCFYLGMALLVFATKQMPMLQRTSWLVNDLPIGRHSSDE